MFVSACRSDVFIQMDVIVPSVNGTDGAYIAVRVTGGGCGMASAKGLFFWIFPDETGHGKYMLTGDLGTE